jgi:hypothetical protein
MIAKIEDGKKEQENAIKIIEKIEEQLKVVKNFRDSLRGMNAL